jgi:tetratricopeptide (TPR) repeat protein
MKLPSTLISILTTLCLAAALAFADQPPFRIEIQPAKARPDTPGAEEALADRARRYEERGYTERALEAWRAVLEQNAWNPSAIDGIRRNLVHLKRYDEAIQFTEGVIARTKVRSPEATDLGDRTSPFALTLGLGEIYLAQGESERAWEIWHRALASEAESPYAVMLLVRVLQENRLWEDAENLIRDFRKRANQPAFMSRELAQSLQMRMEWGAATEELIIYMKESPAGWEIAQRVLARFPDDETVHAEVSAALSRTVRKDKHNTNLRRLFAGYLFNIRDFEASYQQVIVVDSLADRHGVDILGFAQRLLGEEETALASRVFSRVLDREPELGTRLQAELGLADCLLRLGRHGDAKAAYEAFVQEHPQSPEITQARFRIADITLEYERRPEEALEKLRAIEDGGQNVSRSDVRLKMGDCLVWLDRIPEAIKVWRNVATAGITGDIRAEARLRTARAHLWLDSLVQANAVLDSILRGDLASTCYNDAVHYSNIIMEGGQSQALHAFAQGDLFLFREDPSRAAEHFERAVDLARRGRLAEWGRYLQAVALRKAGKAEASVRTLEQFVEGFPESRDIDRAIFLMGQVQEEDLQDAAAAVSSYEKILADFPESTYLEQARKRARALVKAL